MLFYLLFVAAFIALLMFVSTKIRNAANAAYEPEIVERENFKIFKPEGYLNPVEWTETVPFEAYTRELGERSMGRLRKSAAKMTVSDGLNFDNLRKEIKSERRGICFDRVRRKRARRSKNLSDRNEKNGKRNHDRFL